MSEHGTRSCYVKGCRRAECAAANRVYQRRILGPRTVDELAIELLAFVRYRARTIRRPVRRASTRRHGTRSCYVLGCRRPECVEANRAYHAKRRRAAA